MTTSTQRQNRRGTATQCDAMTPAAGEWIHDTTNNRPRFGDGSRGGGWPGPNFKDIQNQAFTAATTTGSANAYVLALALAPAAYAAGQFFSFKANFTNSGSATIAVNGLSAITMKKLSSGALVALASGEIVQDAYYIGFYNSTGPCVQIMSLLDTAGAVLSVSQGDLSTSTGTISRTFTMPGANAEGWGADIATPGGQYGFWPDSKVDTTSGTTAAGWVAGRVNTSYGNYATPFAITTGGGTRTVSGQQRYITASPPFDLGDGEAGGFIFLLLNASGDVVAHYAADVPPWAYNGPTDIRAHRVCPVTGKKYRRVMKKRSLDEVMQGAKIKYTQQVITQRIKNADMGLIPHPFGDVPPGHTVVLLDPLDDRLPGLIEYQNAGGGEDIVDALHAGKIYADNEAITQRKGPAGVMQAKLRFKYSKN